LATEGPLWRAIRATHERWTPGAPEQFPPPPRWELQKAPVGTEKPPLDQQVARAVPTVPTVPTEKQKECARTGAEARGAWEERAAILEFDGGFSRAEAERLATEELAAHDWDHA
jgi:hypothetical protein